MLTSSSHPLLTRKVAALLAPYAGADLTAASAAVKRMQDTQSAGTYRQVIGRFRGAITDAVAQSREAERVAAKAKAAEARAKATREAREKAEKKVIVAVDATEKKDPSDIQPAD